MFNKGGKFVAMINWQRSPESWKKLKYPYSYPVFVSPVTNKSIGAKYIVVVAVMILA